MIEVTIGVLSSLVASVVFLLGMNVVFTPKFRISPSISAYPTDNGDGNDTYRIKVINDRHRAASDVSVQVYVQHDQNVRGGAVKVKKAIGAKFNQHAIPAREWRVRDANNCRRIRIDREELEEVILSRPNPRVVVEVYARDSWSGVGKAFRQEYPLGLDSFERGSFIWGNTLEIQPYSGGQKFKLQEEFLLLKTVPTPTQDSADASSSLG